MKMFFYTVAGACLIGSLQAQEAKDEIGAIVGAAAGAVEPVDVAKALKDQLIVADGEQVKAAELDGGMDYYLVYHSASW